MPGGALECFFSICKQSMTAVIASKENCDQVVIICE